MLEEHGLPSRTSATAECSSWVLPRKHLSCSRAASRSAGLEKRCAERQRLVGAEHQPARLLRRHGMRLFAGQQQRDIAGIGEAGACLDPALVDIGRQHLDRNARRFQQRSPRRALRGQHQRPIGKPERHEAQATGCRRRSASSFSTAAAVSSIERRVTSINGQLCLAQSLREKVDLLGHRLAVDILVVVVMRLEAEQPVLPDLHDALRAGIEPDHQRMRQRLRRCGGTGIPGTSGTLPVFTPRLAR